LFQNNQVQQSTKTICRRMVLQVVLLGLYNGQRLEGEPETDLVSYSRVTEVGAAEGRGRMQHGEMRMLPLCQPPQMFDNLLACSIAHVAQLPPGCPQRGPARLCCSSH
jgi:hypothetical protein